MREISYERFHVAHRIGRHDECFDDHPHHPDVDWGRYDRITELQEQRLYEELSKPHNTPGNPACNVNDVMDEILF